MFDRGSRADLRGILSNLSTEVKNFLRGSHDDKQYIKCLVQRDVSTLNISLLFIDCIVPLLRISKSIKNVIIRR